MPPKYPPGIFARGQRLWLNFYDAAGVRHRKPTGHRLSEVKAAELELKIIKDTIARGQHVESCPYTVAEWAEKWWMSLKDSDPSAKQDYSWLKNHVLPVIGKLRLSAVTKEDIRSLVLSLKQPAKDLAPRSVRNIWWATKRMLGDAVPKLLEASPCEGALKKKDLPRILDKDRRWRQTAIFTRDEARLLISDRRLPVDHRVMWAIGFLAGLRAGEVCALRVGDYDSAQVLLGRLTITSSYTRINKREKETKTGNVRLIPVHPLLAAVLSDWLKVGWADHFGRAPRADDLLLPNRVGRQLNDNNMNDARLADFEALQLRPRRFHDARRTFISLMQADSVQREVVKAMTHTSSEVMDLYTTYPWETLCEAIGKLKLTPSPARPTLAAVPRSPRKKKVEAVNLSQFLSQSEIEGCKPMKLLQNDECPRRDSNPSLLAQLTANEGITGVCGEADSSRTPQNSKNCDSVTETPLARRIQALLAAYGGAA